MTNKIVNGDYVKCADKTDLQRVEYIDEVLQNIKLLLTASRGSFYPNKNFGSNLKRINAQPFEEYALAYARQALQCVDGVRVVKARLNNNTLNFDVIINEEERQVTLELENNI